MSEVSGPGYENSQRFLDQDPTLQAVVDRVVVNELAFPLSEQLEEDVRSLPTDEITMAPDHFDTFLALIDEDGYYNGPSTLTDNPAAGKTADEAIAREIDYNLSVREDQPTELPSWVKVAWTNKYGQPTMIEPEGEIQ